MGRRAKSAKVSVESKRPSARKSPKTEGVTDHDLEKRLAAALKREAEALKRESEALEQQTATSAILRVISSSPTDMRPVFDAIVRSAARLCHAANAAIFLTDGRILYNPANHGSAPEVLAAARSRYPSRGFFKPDEAL